MAPTFQRFRPFQTPARYHFVDPDTQREYSAFTKSSLVKQIENYRLQNKLDRIDELDAVIDHYLCLQPENVGKCESAELKRGLFQTIKGGIALLENVFFGEGGMVIDEEAEYRASVCVQCPHNVFPDKKGFVRWSDKLAQASTDGRKTSLHDKLGNCEVCTCPLRAKVFKKPPFHLSKEEQDRLPSFCWQKGK